eukprot:scaffold10796_cov114-Isochrysis_galbana.AAC.5
MMICWVPERWVLLAGPGIEPPSAAVRVGERCHQLVGTRHERKPHRVFLTAYSISIGAAGRLDPGRPLLCGAHAAARHTR